MADQVQLRGGSTSQNDGFTGAPRELSVDSTKKTVRVHDGATQGGFELARADQVLPSDGGTVNGNLTVTGDLDVTGDLTGIVDLAVTGDIQTTSLNGGQLAGFRNVLINGAVSINQRGTTYAAAATGAYWADRWKKTAGGMVQIIEDGNYAPSTVHTLSGTGVTTQQVTSPANGNWTTPDVPSTATNIQLEPGPVATSFEHRPVGLELSLCQRYFVKQDFGTSSTAKSVAYSTGNFTTQLPYLYYFPVEMRAQPTVDFTGLVVKTGTTVRTPTLNLTETPVMRYIGASDLPQNTTGNLSVGGVLLINAEL